MELDRLLMTAACATLALAGCATAPRPSANGVLAACEPTSVQASATDVYMLCRDGRLLRFAGDHDDPLRLSQVMAPDVKALAVQSGEVCILTSTGVVACTGAHTDTASDENHPGCAWHGATWTKMFQDATQLLAGGEGFCVRKRSGEVLCWGKNVDRAAYLRCPALPPLGLPQYWCEPCRMVDPQERPVRASALWMAGGEYCIHDARGALRCFRYPPMEAVNEDELRAAPPAAAQD